MAANINFFNALHAGVISSVSTALVAGGNQAITVLPPHHDPSLQYGWLARALFQKMRHLMGVGFVGLPSLDPAVLPHRLLVQQNNIATLVAEELAALVEGPQPYALRLACAQAVLENTVMLYDCGTGKRACEHRPPPFQVLQEAFTYRTHMAQAAGFRSNAVPLPDPVVRGLPVAPAIAGLPFAPAAPGLPGLPAIHQDPNPLPRDPLACFPGLPAACLYDRTWVPHAGLPTNVAQAMVFPVVVLDGECAHPWELMPGWGEDMVLFSLDRCPPEHVFSLPGYQIGREWISMEEW